VVSCPAQGRPGEGAKFWLRVTNELKTRSVGGRSDRNRRRPEGLHRSDQGGLPADPVQTCIVHLIRHSRALVSYKDRKAMVAALKQIYEAADADAGSTA
jgi:putative transposase